MTSSPPTPSLAAGGEILIVEDTPASLQLLADLLTQAGYTARRARDGRMALLSAQAQPPDLVLLDIRMPGMDGYEVCRRLKADARTRDVPVIFLSALRETEDKVHAFGLGAVDYIAKPYQPDEVLARVRTHVELHRLRADLEARVAERTAQYREAEARLEESRGRLRELAAFLENVREEERSRIARELHDELGQSLTALRIDLGWLKSRCATDAGAAERLAVALGLVERTTEAVRRISEDLRPRMLDDLGLAAAVEHHVQQFAKRTGIACELTMNREEFELDGATATALYRIVQEALTNVARHADAGRIAVRIEATENDIGLVVEDDGRGMPADRGNNTFGLLGMQERVEMLAGRLRIGSAAGGGTRVEVRLPIQGEASKHD
ncbi:MAG: response regulator [Sterolibacteriaceae bacterium MAG5]|nr:response regulator [Candidatus Nitricoxidireducens bremensis]